MDAETLQQIAIVLETVAGDIEVQGHFHDPDFHVKIIAARDKLRELAKLQHRLKPISLVGDLQENIRKVIPDDPMKQQRCLCQYRHKLFVDNISLLKLNSSSIQPNCKDGWLYVDSGSEAVPLDKLDALYYIEGGDL